MENAKLCAEEDIITMAAEPIEDVTPEQWLHLNNNCESEMDLANALAGVWNQANWLAFDCDEEDCPKETVALCNAWFDLEFKLIDKVKEILQEEYQDALLQDISPYQIIKPFMERNGYLDGRGWWIVRRK
jgi:hypothetical protein